MYTLTNHIYSPSKTWIEGSEERKLYSIQLQGVKRMQK